MDAGAIGVKPRAAVSGAMLAESMAEQTAVACVAVGFVDVAYGRRSAMTAMRQKQS